MSSLLGRCLATLGTAGIALVVLANSFASPSAVRAVDRSYLCSVGLTGGIRQLAVNAQSGVRDPSDVRKWAALAHASITLGPDTSLGVQGGSPKSPGGVPQPESTFWANTGTCRRTSARILLSSAGLDGWRVNQFLERYRCEIGRRVLVRIRAEFSRPAVVRTRSGVLGSFAPVRAGSLVVRTEAGKPLAYADVNESGRTRLHLVPRCQS
jgi:hypothetical protein